MLQQTLKSFVQKKEHRIRGKQNNKRKIGS